jgi:hypothetical protein
MREPRCLTTLWAFVACYRDSFTFFYLNVFLRSLKFHRFFLLYNKSTVSRRVRQEVLFILCSMFKFQLCNRRYRSTDVINVCTKCPRLTYKSPNLSQTNAVDMQTKRPIHLRIRPRTARGVTSRPCPSPTHTHARTQAHARIRILFTLPDQTSIRLRLLQWQH